MEDNAETGQQVFPYGSGCSRAMTHHGRAQSPCGQHQNYQLYESGDEQSFEERPYAQVAGNCSLSLSFTVRMHGDYEELGDDK